MSRVIVTGSRGFIGSRIAAYLNAHGTEVLGLPGREAIRSFLVSPSGAEPSVVIHCGFSVDFSARNTGSKSENLVTSRLLANYLKVRPAVRLIFPGAAGALGVSERPEVRDESKWGSSDPAYSGYMNSRYIRDQIESEQLFRESCRSLAVLCLTTVYGPGMAEKTLRSMRAATGWSPLVLVPPGGSSYLGLEDLLSAMDTVLAEKPEGRYVVSSGNFLFADFYHALFQSLGIQRRKCIFRLPQWTRAGVGFAASCLARGGLERAVLESTYGFKYYNPGKLMRETRWRPRAQLKDRLRELFGPQCAPKSAIP